MKTTLLQILNDKTLISNGAVLTITFTNVEMVLKIILLTASIVWTVIKISQDLKKKKDV
jgi:hypothetical protein